MNDKQLISIIVMSLMLSLPLAQAFTLSQPEYTVEGNSATINWTSSVSADSEVQYGKSTAKTLRGNNDELVTSHSIVLNGLEEYTKYYYKVVSKDENNTIASYPIAGSSQELAFITLDVTPPPRVLGIGIINVTVYTIKLSWEHVGITDFGKYLIYRDGVNIINQTNTEYIDTDLLPGMPYEYKVRAIDTHGNLGAFSDIVAGYTMGADKEPPQISNLGVAASSGQEAIINWQTDENADSKLKYGEVPNLELEIFKETRLRNHSITLTDLEIDSSYSYQAISCDLNNNCQQSDIQTFTAGADVSPPEINAEIPTYYNSPGLDIDVYTGAWIDVKIYVNDIYSRAGKADSEGLIHFDQIILNSALATNFLKIIAEDFAGNKAEMIYPIQMDFEGPTLTLTTNISEAIRQGTFTVQGYVDKACTIEFYVENDPFDKSTPEKVTSLNFLRAEENLVELTWNQSRAEDLNYYTVYREDLGLMQFTDQTSYLDTFVGPGQVYKYWIGAVDLDCQEGETSQALTVKTAEGVTAEVVETFQEVISPCDINEPIAVLEVSGSFEQQITLREGNLEFTIIATDAAGNTDEHLFSLISDSGVPVFEFVNLENEQEVSPTYNKEITVYGKLNEPADVYAFINLENKNTISKGDAVAVTQTDGNGSFSMEITLERNEEFEEDRGTAWRNDIILFAEDRVGLNTTSQTYSIKFAQCGSETSWWHITPTRIFPNELTPRLLLQGMDMITLELELEWLGLGDIPKLDSGDFNINYLDLNIEKQKHYDREDITENPQIYLIDSIEGSGIRKAAIVIQLDKFEDPTPEGENWSMYQIEKNISQRHKGYCFTDADIISNGLSSLGVLEGLGCVRLPLEITLDFQYADYNEDIQQGYHKECLFVDTVIQPPLNPNKLYNKDIIQTMINFIDTTIEVIDAVLKPIESVQKALSLGCVFATVTLMVKKWTEWMSCNDLFELAGISSLSDKCASCEISGESIVCDGNSGDSSKEYCESCIGAKLFTLKFQRAQQLICDRVNCQAIPSFDTYRERQNQFSFNGEGACVQVDAEGDSSPVVITDYEALLDVNAGTTAGAALNSHECDICSIVPGADYCQDPANDCCAVQYQRDWDSAALFLNELKESVCIWAESHDDGTIKDRACGSGITKLFRGVRDFSICKDNIQQTEYALPFSEYDNVQIVIKKEDNVGEGEEEWGLYLRNRMATRFEVVEEGISMGVMEETETEVEGENEDETLDSTRLVWETTDNRIDGTSVAQIKDKCQEIVNNEITFGSREWPKVSATFNEIETETSFYSDYLHADDENLQGVLAEVDIESVDTSGCDCKDACSDNEKRIAAYQTENGLGVDCLSGVNTLGSLMEENPDNTYLQENLNQLNHGGIEISQNSGSTVTRTITRKPLPLAIVNFICDDFVPQAAHILDPRQGLLKSMQAVCLPTIQAYLKQTKNILIAFKGCFNHILITGKGSAGACQKFLSTYICDLIYYSLNCIHKLVPAQDTSREFSGGIGGFTQYMVLSMQEVQQGVERRYGSQSSLSTFLSGEGVFNAVCMGMFGIDTGFDMQTLFDVGTSGAQIEPFADLTGSTRRFTGIDFGTGYTTHSYYVPAIVITQQQVDYRIELICSNDFSCQESEGFEGGICDCASMENPHRVQVAMGRLDEGDSLNEEFIQTVGQGKDAYYRYDKVRLTYSYMVDNRGPLDERGQRVEKTQTWDLMPLGGTAPAYCFFRLDQEPGFRCSISTDQGAKAKFIDPVAGEAISYNLPDFHLGDDLISEDKETSFSFVVESLMKNNYDEDMPIFLNLKLTNNQMDEEREVVIDTMDARRIMEIGPQDYSDGALGYKIQRDWFASIEGAHSCKEGWCITEPTFTKTQMDSLSLVDINFRYNSPDGNYPTFYLYNSGGDWWLYDSQNIDESNKIGLCILTSNLDSLNDPDSSGGSTELKHFIECAGNVDLQGVNKQISVKIEYNPNINYRDMGYLKLKYSEDAESSSCSERSQGFQMEISLMNSEMQGFSSRMSENVVIYQSEPQKLVYNFRAYCADMQTIQANTAGDLGGGDPGDTIPSEIDSPGIIQINTADCNVFGNANYISQFDFIGDKFEDLSNQFMNQVDIMNIWAEWNALSDDEKSTTWNALSDEDKLATCNVMQTHGGISPDLTTECNELLLESLFNVGSSSQSSQNVGYGSVEIPKGSYIECLFSVSEVGDYYTDLELFTNQGTYTNLKLSIGTQERSIAYSGISNNNFEWKSSSETFELNLGPHTMRIDSLDDTAYLRSWRLRIGSLTECQESNPLESGEVPCMCGDELIDSIPDQGQVSCVEGEKVGESLVGDGVLSHDELCDSEDLIRSGFTFGEYSTDEGGIIGIKVDISKFDGYGSANNDNSHCLQLRDLNDACQDEETNTPKLVLSAISNDEFKEILNSKGFTNSHILGALNEPINGVIKLSLYCVPENLKTDYLLNAGANIHTFGYIWWDKSSSPSENRGLRFFKYGFDINQYSLDIPGDGTSDWPDFDINNYLIINNYITFGQDDANNEPNDLGFTIDYNNHVDGCIGSFESGVATTTSGSNSQNGNTNYPNLNLGLS